MSSKIIHKLEILNRFARRLLAGAACFLSVAAMNLYAHNEEWATPTFDVLPLENFELSISTSYLYRQSEVINVDEIPVLNRDKSSMRSAEHALISRMSAVRNLDYDWWVQTWDPDSWALAKAKYASHSYDRNFWIDNWKSSFNGKKLSLKHKVEFGGYVILTYMFSDKKMILPAWSTLSFLKNKW